MANVKAWSVGKRKASGFVNIGSNIKKPRGRPRKRYNLQEVHKFAKIGNQPRVTKEKRKKGTPPPPVNKYNSIRE